MTVVKQLNQKYPRATESVRQILDITDRNLAAYLASGDALWPKLRDFVHICAHLQGLRPDYYTDVKIADDIRCYYRGKGWERIAERLDRKEIQVKLKEQESRGGGGASVSE
jgi:hypothetical protein